MSSGFQQKLEVSCVISKGWLLGLGVLHVQACPFQSYFSVSDSLWQKAAALSYYIPFAPLDHKGLYLKTFPELYTSHLDAILNVIYLTVSIGLY